MQTKDDILKTVKHKILAAMGHLAAADSMLSDPFHRRAPAAEAVYRSLSSQLDALQQTVDFINHTVLFKMEENREQKRRKKNDLEDEAKD